jgi:hypothetical protein
MAPGVAFEAYEGRFSRASLRRRWRSYAAAAVVVIALYVYYKLLVRHGTVSPLAVWSYTADFQHARPLADTGAQLGHITNEALYKLYLNGESPPSDWRPSSRVVVTLSTLPHHLEWLDPTLNSLLAQSVRPDAIVLAVPEISRRTGKPYGPVKVPTGVTVLRTKVDYGPLTKLLPALKAEEDPDTIVISVDDDKVYHKDLVRQLTWHAEFKYVHTRIAVRTVRHGNARAANAAASCERPHFW